MRFACLIFLALDSWPQFLWSQSGSWSCQQVMCFRTAFVDADGTIETAQTSEVFCWNDTRYKQDDHVQNVQKITIPETGWANWMREILADKLENCACGMRDSHSFARGHMAHWTALLEDLNSVGVRTFIWQTSMWQDLVHLRLVVYIPCGQIRWGAHLLSHLMSYVNCALTISTKPWIEAITGHGGAEARALKMVWDLAARMDQWG